MSKLNLAPYINFQGRAREAMEYYHQALGGTLELFAQGEGGNPRPAEPGEPIMHARLEADGVTIIASDGHPAFRPTVGDHIGLAIGGPDEPRMREIFDALADGGEVKMALTKMPWGTSGWLRDRFGINWNVDISG